ncbi:MAG: glycosyltransferase [Deltaproteobacteria bacterium]|nr:glycosyltransferase [Deltaproteobacteria bacterium]
MTDRGRAFPTEGPWLSVVMPTFNGAAHLEEALASVAAARDPGVELIAVDDGSTDATLRILDRYASLLPLEVVTRGRVGNWVANTNHGLSRARAPWACILHQDDRWRPGRLPRLRRLIERDPGVDFAFHASRYVDEAGEVLGRWTCPLTDDAPLQPTHLVQRLLVQNFIAVPAPVFRRELFERVGGMDDRLWYTADWDLWLKLAAAGPSRYCAAELADFRLHALSQTLQGSKDQAAFREQLETVLERHLAIHGLSGGAVARAARFSVELNVAAAGAYHGRRAALGRLAFLALTLGPGAARAFLRDSRIHQRALSRLRLQRRILTGRHGTETRRSIDG